MGKNTIGAVPKDIATFLNLENPATYTGHSFRRTSASLFVDQGGDLLGLKRLGDWRSNTVAEGYVNDSLLNKKNASKLIAKTMDIASKSEPKRKDILTDNYANKETSSKVKNCITKNNFMAVPSTSGLNYPLNTESSSIAHKYSSALPKMSPTKKKRLQPIEEIDCNMSQEDLLEVTSTDFLARQKQKIQPIEEIDCNISQKDLLEVTSTDFLGNNIVAKTRPVYIFKNCNFTINLAALGPRAIISFWKHRPSWSILTPL